MPTTLLLIGNDKASLKTYAGFFSKRDFSVVIATSGRQALSLAKTHNLDVVVLDTTALRLNFKSLSKKLCNESAAPVVLIAAPNARLDSAIANVGIVTKPVNAKKFLARVKTAIDEKPPKLLERGNLLLDLEKHRLTRGSKSFKLTPKEFVLIKLFMGRAGQTISRKTLMKEVWDTDYLGDTRTLDVHIRWVREKVEESPSKPQRLVTVRGQGYKLQMEK